MSFEQTPVPPPEEPPSTYQTVPIKLPVHRAYVTYTLLGLTILVYLLQWVTQWFWGIDIPQAIGVKYNPLIVQGQYWRLITPMFLHGSLLHIAFNMFALVRLGPGLERFYGHLRYLLLYLVAGFAGNVVSFALSAEASLGSSTAIFGLIGAEGVFLYQNRKVFGGQTQAALQQVIMLAVLNLAIGLSPGIDNWGHLGGLIGGSCFAWLAGPILHVEGAFPTFTLVDSRTTRDTWLAFLGVSGCFMVLALALIFLRGS
jgi:rhomboid protease GluP